MCFHACKIPDSQLKQMKELEEARIEITSFKENEDYVYFTCPKCKATLTSCKTLTTAKIKYNCGCGCKMIICLKELDKTSKLTNPKDSIGSDKLPLHLFPTTAKYYGCLALLDGCLKYGRSNFRSAGVRASIYYDALNRHIDKWFEGQDKDEDSGLPHLAHAIACIAILIEATEAKNMTDDRMFPTNFDSMLKELTPEVKRLKEKYKDKNPRHWTIADKGEEEVGF
jgi:predicted RNA-binding Zn-ribbon protein involved in translation (DUF1610 family)